MALLSWFRRRSRKLTLRVQFIVEPDGDRFHAYSPALKGLHADGATEEEAARGLIAEIPAYLESLARHGDPLPVGLESGRAVDAPALPAGAFLRQVTLQWPTQDPSGLSSGI
jgi:predicted RNase H-like HicB family nuclease